MIYDLGLRQGHVWMLTQCAKNETDTIPAPVLEKIKEEIDGFSVEVRDVVGCFPFGRSRSGNRGVALHLARPEHF